MPFSTGQKLQLPPETKLIASAVAGDRRSLERLAAFPKLSDLVVAHRAGPVLAVRADELGVEGSCVGAWRDARGTAQVVGQWQRAGLEGVAASLGKAGVRWAPFLGAALIGSVLPVAEECASSGLDILIAPGDLDRARRALKATGWRAEDESPTSERYLAEEGCLWRARDSRGLALQVYHRLWGCVPPALAEGALARARPDAALGAAGLRLAPPDAYALSAVNAWLAPRPRSLLLWWELHRLAESAGQSLPTEVLRETKLTGLHLYVGLAAAAADSLWEGRYNREVARLLDSLSRPERVAMTLLRRTNLEWVRPGLLLLACQLGGRHSRLGWRSLTRAVWAHPAVVERMTPAEWKWSRRRAWHVARSLGLVRQRRED